ncbi:MAG TPA: hypothetical protein VNT01_02045 [Symbiobacteriaceae bacterium]|nr:hypothetical protein [Symbiobacteriaceae bacterium]
MRRFAVGFLTGLAANGLMWLLALAGAPLPSPVPMLLSAGVYGALGWLAAAGAGSPKDGLSRAAMAGLGCCLGAWLVSLAVLMAHPQGWPAVALAGLVAELKFVAVAGLFGRKRGQVKAPTAARAL